MTAVILGTQAITGAFAENRGTIPGSLDADFDDMEMDVVVSAITRVQAPYITKDYAVFTADKNARYVALSVDFEGYQNIHKYQLKTVYDSENNAVDQFYVYVMKLPKNIQSFKYRMVIDGLWTADPSNPSRTYDRELGLVVSSMNASRIVPEVTEPVPVGMVRFVYKGASGQKIRLGGSFTNWDSWIYQLREVKPGLYQLDLPLPPGKYEYAYYSGMNSMVDQTNPERCYTPDGKEASLIIVK